MKSKLPKGWKQITVGDVAIHVTSGSRGWSHYEVKRGPRFYGVGDLPKEGIKINPTATRYVLPPTASGEGERTKIRPGDILVSITADLGRIGFIKKDHTEEGYVNQHLALLRLCSDTADPEFVAHVLSGMEQRVRLLRLNDSNAKSGLNLETIRNFPFPLPPVPEQQRITAVLGAWDRSIDQTGRLIVAKQRRFNAARIRLIESFQSAGKGSNSWTPTEFGQITEELKQRNAAGHGPDRVMGVIKGEGLVPMRSHVMAADLRRYLVVPPQAIAYNPMRLNIGSIAASQYDEDVLVSPDYVVFRARKGRADPNFLRFLIGTKRWRDHLITVGSGSVRTRIYFDGLAEMVLRVPDVGEQKRIGQILTAMEEDLKTTIEAASALRIQKRGLMQKLLTGEWRLDERFDPSPAPRQAHLGGVS